MIRTFLSLISLFIISACSTSYERLGTIENQKNNTFAESLFNNYKEKATFEAKKMHDWNSAELYSEKALKALEGKNIKPQEIKYWKLPKNHIFKLTQSYNNLIEIYDEARISDPYNLAVAISSLDCWAEQQEENWQTWDINNCRNDFLNAMHNIYTTSLEQEKQSLFLNNENKINKESVSVFTNNNNEILQIIYFDFDDHKLSQVSKNILREFLKKYQKKINKFVIIGHSDTKGAKEYNFNLSIKRAENVKAILVKEGINKKNISIIGKGEEFLAVLTNDEIAHPANRRVEIQPLN